MPAQSPMLPEISVAELGKKLKSQEPFILLDVREQDEVQIAKIDDPRVEFSPMSKLARLGISALPESAQRGEIPVYVLCHHGIRSMQVTAWLQQQGYTHVINVSSGIHEYARMVDSSVGFY